MWLMGMAFSVAADDFNGNKLVLSAAYPPARIAALNQLSAELIRSDPTRAKAIAEDALAVAKSIRDDRPGRGHTQSCPDSVFQWRPAGRCRHAT
jgi:hypothetical protein